MDIAGRGKVYLCEDEAVVVTRYHINCVVGSLEHKGMLNSDNRTGFDGLLHSVGVMRNKVNTPCFFSGMLWPLLLPDRSKV